MTNSYSSFEYEKAADILTPFDRRVKEEEANNKLIEGQMADNMKMREKDADSNAKMYKALFELAPKAAEAGAKVAQEMDKRHVAKLKHLMLQAEIDWEDFHKYRTEDKQNIAFSEAIQGAINDNLLKSKEIGADSTHYLEIVDGLRKLNTRDAKRIARYTIHEAGSDENLDTLKNLHINKVQLEDGTTWAGASPDEKRLLLDEFLEQHALGSILPFSDGLLKYDSGFGEKIKSWKKKVLKSESVKYEADWEKTDKAEGQAQLIAASKSTPEQLLITLNEVIGRTSNYFNQTNPKDQKEATEYWLGIIEAGVLSGDIKIQTYESMLNLPVDHRGMTNSDGTHKKVKALTFLGFDVPARIQALKAKLVENKTDDIEEWRKAKGLDFDIALEARGGQINEEDIKQTMLLWDKNPEVIRRDLIGKYPDQVKAAAGRTIEDIAQLPLIEMLTAQLDDESIFVDKNRILLIEDEAKRNELLKRAETEEGHGLAKAELTEINSRLTSLVKDKLNLEQGASGNHPDVKEHVDSAMHNYLKLFRNGRNQYGSPAANHKQAYDAVKAEIYDGVHYRDQRNLDTTKAYSNKMEAIRVWRTSNPKTFLTKGLLPGTEKDFKQLEQWAANPVYGTFPAIYNELSKKIEAYILTPEGGRKRLDGWMWASAQYKAMTGKELPPLTGKVAEIQNDKNWLNYVNRPSSHTYNQGLVNSGELDLKDFTTPGVEVIEVIK